MRILLLISLLLVFQGKAQKSDNTASKIVSTEKMLEKIKRTKPDSIYLDSLISVGKSLMDIDLAYSKDCILKSRDLSLSLYGSLDERHLESMHQYAIILFVEKDYQGSIKINKETMELRGKKYPEGHIQILRSKMNLCNSLINLGENQQYEELMWEVIEGLLISTDYNRKIFSTAFYNFSGYMKSNSRFKESFMLLDEFALVQSRNNDLVGLAETEVKIGRNHLDLGENVKAIEIIKKSIESLKYSKVVNDDLARWQLKQLTVAYMGLKQFNDAKKVFEQLESISKNNLFYLGSARSGLALIARIEGDIERSNIYIEQIKKDYTKHNKQKSIEFAELMYDLAILFGSNEFDQEALDFCSITYDIYKNLPERGGNRFYSVALEYGTALQNIGQNDKAIEVYEDIMRAGTTDFLRSPSFIRLCMNLGGSYSNRNELEKATKVRNEGFKLYFKRHISEFEDAQVEKNRFKQLRDLHKLGKYDEMQICLEEFKNYYVLNGDKIRQVDCFLELSSLYINNFYNPNKAQQYLDSAKLSLSNQDNLLPQNGIIKYLEADILRRLGEDQKRQQELYTDAYTIFKKIGDYTIPYFKFCTYHLAYIQLINDKENALRTVEDFTVLLCEREGENSFNCLNSKIKQIEFLAEVIDVDSLKQIINSVELEYKKLLESQSDSRIEFNTVKLLSVKENSPEGKKIILENIQLSERNSNFQNTIHWKAKLAENYFMTDSTAKGLEVWNAVFMTIDQNDLNEIKTRYKERYAWQLVEYNVDIKQAIQLLENETTILKEKRYESYDLLIDTYIKADRLDKAYSIILEKEEFLKANSGYEEELIILYGKKIKYFELLGDKKNLLRCHEERYAFLENVHQNNPNNLATALVSLGMLYIELGNSKKGIELITRKIEDFGWSLDQRRTSESLGDSTLDYVLLHFYKNVAQFNYGLINMDYQSFNVILAEFNQLKTLTEKWNPTYGEVWSKDFMLKFFPFFIDLTTIFIGENIAFSETEYENLLLEFNQIKNIDPIMANILKHQIVMLLDYFEKDIELYEFSLENSIQLEPSFYDRKGLFNEADSIRINRIKSEITEMNKTKFLLSDEEQLAMKQKITWSLNNDLLSFVAKIHYTNPMGLKYSLLSDNHNDHRSTNIKSSEVYELVLNSSGSILENKKKLNKEIKERTDLRMLYDQWKILYQSLNSSHLDTNNLSSLKDSISLIERKLFQESGLIENKWFNYSEVKKRLKDNELIIHTVRIYGNDAMNHLNPDSVIYLHFVIDNMLEEPLIYAQKMNSEEELELSNIFKYHTQGKGKKEKDLSTYSALFGFLSENDQINKKKRIIYIPDGIFHEINLAAVYDPKENHYMASIYQIDVYDIAGKIAFSDTKSATSLKTAVLFGAPDFSSDVENELLLNNTSATRSLESQLMDSLSRGGLNIMPLPETKREVDKVNNYLEKGNWDVSIYTAGFATESTLKQIRQPGILHIATHGYFLEDVPFESSGNSYLGMNRDRLIEDPMLRSGLLLAGANNALKDNNTGENNGIFSAFEASLLDLTNTELVVLSACETGKGEIKNSEGVYGLRKAFADAGAKNVIMSLWKVDDKVTQEFMARFYEVWLNDKITIREAFNKTQLEIMAKYPQPYYWGAFILVEN